MKHIILKRWLMCSCLLAAGVLAGCENNPTIQSDPARELATGENSAIYLHRMSNTLTVTENDACRGLLFLVDGEDTAATFEQRVQRLRDAKVLNPNWSCNATRPITRGRLAYMIYQGCQCKGGVILTLAGPSERYCLRELRYRQLMYGKSESGQITGMEMVGVLGRADVYKRTGTLSSQMGDWEEE